MTDRQVAVLRQRRMEGKTQETAAVMATMSDWIAFRVLLETEDR